MVSGSSWALFRPPPGTSDDCEMCPESLLLPLSRRRALKQREGKLHPGAAHLSHVQRGHFTLLLKCENADSAFERAVGRPGVICDLRLA